jgi:hypothetical protein
MVAALLAGCTGAGSDAPRHPRATTAWSVAEDDWKARFAAELADSGFVLSEGAAAQLDTADCCAWQSCYLFNPDNDYIGWLVPPSPGQTVRDPVIQDGLSLAWRLRADEAVVAMGRTPPPAAYFSYRSYIHDRWSAATGQREWLFFNLGDSINHLVIGTGEGGPFDADFVTITTADAVTEAAIRAAAARAGVPDRILNTDPIAGTDVALGIEDRSDTFRMQNRMALWDDPVAGQAYLDAPPVRVFRVTPTVERAHVAIAAPALRPRGTGTDETAWGDAAARLDAAIRAAYPDYVAHDLPTVVPSTADGDCPPGCNRDTFFAVSTHFPLPQDADGFVVAYGVNHQRTGKSVYANFAVGDTEQLSGVAGATSADMPGSARTYLPDDPQVDDLYAYRISRTCLAGDPYCVAVPYECPGFPSDGTGSIAYRAYTEPATATGPSSSELVVDRAMLFTRPTP